ncbi:MAG: hypothetical protein H6Q90_216 [Deltaproteobacteria bacterium]|nr:hypothetical protein [Deltaproteobacteria bacterium]
MIRLGCLSVLVVAAFAGRARAESLPPILRAHAIRRPSAVSIDGRLAEAAWANAPKQSGFTQRFPKDGTKAELETTFSILYDDSAIYVGVWATDPQPQLIRRLLTRRDVDSPADMIAIGFDSYHDRRTAYVFMLNAAGVQRDVVFSDDSSGDDTWDAVWTGDVAITQAGWSAEFRIPLNQLRFPTNDTQEWGMQVVRLVSRTQEQTAWSPWPRSGSEVVSKFGLVDGIDHLKPSRRLELLPYASGGIDSAPVEAGDPLNDGATAIGNLGLDLKYGLGPAFTLSATINPDFGQVEADPSQVNLSANELFFAEKRPFFVEGADLFRLPISSTNGGVEGAFYSRRIGAAPSFTPDRYDYIDSPTATTIYSAAKLTGKTRGGWSVGVFDAVTGQETATIALDGEQSRPVVAPLTNYVVARVKRDLREGKTSLGASATAVNRSLDGTGLEDLLHDQAYSGGLQLEHRWGKNAWSAQLNTIGSVVHGSELAIERTQRSARHLFQRPDNLHLDPTLTSMSGLGAGWMVGRLGDTKHWRFGAGGDARSSGLELNDAGFQRGSDRMIAFYYGEYHDEDPGKRVLNYQINSDIFTVSTFEPRLEDVGLECNGNMQLVNYWSLHLGCNLDVAYWNTGALRGGPALRGDPRLQANLNINTDNRKPVQVSLGAYGGRNEVADSTDGGVDLGVTIQARPNIDLFLGPSWSRRDDAMQYVQEAADELGKPHYVFARINQTTLGMTVRMNWTFSPHLSLQAYAQPFIATGRYSEYKDVDHPDAARFEDRFHRLEGTQLALDSGTFTGNHDGVFMFGRPDFNFAELRSTIVMRWEYRPGSSVFAIWSHGQSASGDDGRFALRSNLDSLDPRTRGEDVVLVKANYWIGL